MGGLSSSIRGSSITKYWRSHLMTRSQVRDVHYYALADIWPCACVMKRMQLAHTRLHVPAWTARLSSATDLLAVMPGTLERLIQWLKMYKTTDGKPANVLASDTPTSAAAASQVTWGAALALKFQTTTKATSPSPRRLSPSATRAGGRSRRAGLAIPDSGSSCEPPLCSD